MKLTDRVAIISKDNLRDLLELYGEFSADRLSEIVNNHVRVAINEINEDLHVSKDNMAL